MGDLPLVDMPAAGRGSLPPGEFDHHVDREGPGGGPAVGGFFEEDQKKASLGGELAEAIDHGAGHGAAQAVAVREAVDDEHARLPLALLDQIEQALEGIPEGGDLLVWFEIEDGGEDLVTRGVAPGVVERGHHGQELFLALEPLELRL